MRTLLVVSAVFLSGGSVAAQQLTDAERRPLVESLNETHLYLAQLAKQLTPEQWSFKAGPDRWSVAEVAEHILVSEELILGVITSQLLKSGSAAPKDQLPVDQVRAVLHDRSQRAQAPEPAVPVGRWHTQAEYLAALGGMGMTAMNYIRETNDDLHARALPNPVFGVIDGYRWLAFLAYHTERHVLQIREVMADPGFPASGDR